MAYTAFDQTLPDGSTQSGAQVDNSIVENFKALWHGIVMGVMKGWNYSKTDGTGTAEEPQYMFYKNGTDWIRLTLTWSSGRVTQTVYDYSSNSGSSYDTVGTETIAYDGSDNVTSTTWS
jgi:hypothetical protein